MTLLATPSAPPARAPRPTRAVTAPSGPVPGAALDANLPGATPMAPAPTPGPERSRRHRRPRRLVRWWRGVWGQARRSADTGMATAEYAIVTVAAAAFAGLLIAVLRSDEVRGLLVGIIRGALSV